MLVRASTPRTIAAVTLMLGGLLSAACSSSSGSGTGAASGAGATSGAGGMCSMTSGAGGLGPGPVTGPKDMHCVGVPPQPTNQGVCHTTSLPPDASATGGAGPEYGVTMYNSEGDDDDCKYHVSWTSTPIAEHCDVTFTLTGIYLANGTPDPPACADCPIQGLNTCNMLAEVYLDDTHPAPPTDQVVTSSKEGTYSIGPIVFDAPGKWTVRFHLFELCADIREDSPHGHAAFYVDVP